MKPEGQCQGEKQHATNPCHLTRPAIRLEKDNADEVQQRARHHQVCRPGVNRPHQPPKRDARHDELDAFVRFARTRPVVEQQGARFQPE